MKKAILAISFGTSHREQLERSIERVVASIQDEYRTYPVLLAFSSGVIIQKLRREFGITILSIGEALEKLKAEGYEEVVVQPLHLLAGKEYDKVISICKSYQEDYKIKIGKPLLDQKSDYNRIIQFIKEEYATTESMLLLLGHGTTHEADKAYEELAYILREEKVLGTVSTLRRMDMDLGMIIELTKNYGKSNVTIIPFMLVAGMHVMNDIMGNNDTSWQYALANNGLDICVITSGLGESKVVQQIFNEHIKVAGILN